MKRLLTAAIGVPIFLLALFGLPPDIWLLFLAIPFIWGSVEFVQICRRWVPQGPLWLLPPCVVLLTLVLSFPEWWSTYGNSRLMAVMALISLGFGSAVLLGRTPVKDSLPALGVLAFGTPYIALPLASLYYLQRTDPWLVFLLAAIVWLGDTAAYYVGSAIGRHRFAPTVSPKKTWEGSAAGLLIAVLATAVWSYARLGELVPGLLLVGLVTSVAAQLGDLVESMLKRGAGVKDSGTFLPGHGGWLDRGDALVYGAPALWLCLVELGVHRVIP